MSRTPHNYYLKSPTKFEGNRPNCLMMLRQRLNFDEKVKNHHLQVAFYASQNNFYRSKVVFLPSYLFLARTILFEGNKEINRLLSQRRLRPFCVVKMRRNCDLDSEVACYRSDELTMKSSVFV